MVHENKKLATCGVTGVLVALILIASVAMIPSHTPPKVHLSVSVGSDKLLRLEGPKGVTYESWPIIDQPPCILNVTVFEFSKPLGPGSEADLVVALTSKLGVSEIYHIKVNFTNIADINPSFKENFPGGIVFADGGFGWTWDENIETNISKTFNFSIKATGVGLSRYLVDVTTEWKEETPGSGTYVRVHTSIEGYFIILPDNIFVYSQWPEVPTPVALYLDYYNWPSGLGSEFNISSWFYEARAEVNATDVSCRLVLQEGIIAVEGQTEWTGNLTWGQEVSLSARLRFVKLGEWFVYVYVEKDGILLGLPRVRKYIVSEDQIVQKIMM